MPDRQIIACVGLAAGRGGTQLNKIGDRHRHDERREHDAERNCVRGDERDQSPAGPAKHAGSLPHEPKAWVPVFERSCSPQPEIQRHE
jgi:hypothetical protein